MIGKVKTKKPMKRVLNKPNKNQANHIAPALIKKIEPKEAIAKDLNLELLKRNRVVIIGLGGIGLILARYVTLFLSSLSPEEFRLVLYDGDTFEPGNKYRMDVPDFDNKAAATAGQLADLFGRPGLHIRWVPEYVTDKNLTKAVQESDMCLLAVDNHATRNLVNNRCRKMKNVVLISGGNDGLEDGKLGTYGNVQVYQRHRGRDLHPSLERFHPEIANPKDKRPDEIGCVELIGVPQLLFTNLAVASAMCNALWRCLLPKAPPIYDEVCLDIYEAVLQPHWIMVQKVD